MSVQWRPIMVRTLGLGVFVGVLMYILIYGLLPEMEGFDPTMLLYAAIVFAGFRYAGSMMRCLAEGEMVDDMATALGVAGFAVALFVVLNWPMEPLPESIGWYSVPVLAIGAIAAVGTALRHRNETFWLLCRAGIIAGSGYVLSGIVTDLDRPELSEPFLYVMGAVAGLSVLGALHRHGNDYARGIGALFRRDLNVFLLSVLGLGGTLYVIVLRDEYVQDLPQATVIDWGLLIVVVLVLTWTVRRYLKRSTGEFRFSDSRRLEQRLLYDSWHIDPSTEVVRTFVDGGDKVPMIASVTRGLVENGVDDVGVRSVVSEVVDYEEPTVWFATRWTYGDIASREARRRQAIVNRMLGSAQGLLGPIGAPDDVEDEVA